jgi:iron complex outermembrane receptor protein
MFKRSRLALSVAAAVGAIASTGSMSAVAQDPAAQQIEEVVVTGSRIKRTDLTSLSPISVFDEAALDQSGNTTLERFFVSLPSVGGADFGSGVNNGNPGYATVSLRGLGPTRTLVLLNGNRMASAGVNGFVDLNMVPSSIIERVEVLRDGASTVYGSDAIAGVVNLITKTDFDGIEIEGQYDETGEGDGEQNLFAITFGKTFERGNIIVNAQYQEREAIMQKDRAFSDCPVRERGSVADGTRERFCGGSGVTYPGTAYYESNGYSGNVNDGGVVRDYDPAIDSYNFATASYMVTPQDVYSFFSSANYDLIESSPVGTVSAFMETQFSNRESSQLLAAEGTFWGPLVPVTNPGNIFGEDAYVYRRLVETGGRLGEQDVDVWRGLFGFKGELNNGWSWDASYNRSEYRDDSVDRFRGNVTNMNILLDPDLCAADSNCPGVWDPFSVNTLTPEMQAYGLSDARFTDESTMRTIQFNLTGDFGGLELPGGKPQWAVGYESRQEEGSTTYDDNVLAGNVYFYSGENTKADYEVDEWYVELNLPLISDMPFAKAVTAEISTRRSDYDILEDEADVWKYALEWAPVDDLRLRYTYSEGFRAPNISELASPETNTAASYNEPCVEWGTNPDPNVRANCAADGLAPDFTLSSDQAQSLTGGNANLAPEESESTTFGVVWTPSFLDNFSATLDWFDIEIDGAIGSLGVDDIVTGCYSSANFSSPLCALILGPAAAGENPNAVSPRRNVLGLVSGPDLRLGNLSTFETKGIDFQFDYTFDAVFEGALGLTLSGTWLDSYEYTSGPGVDATELAGYFGTDPYQGDNPAAFPELKMNFIAAYSRDNWGGSYTIRWMDEVEDVASTCEGSQLSCDVDAYDYHDVQGYYEWKNVTFTAGVRNLWDEEPPYVSNNGDMNTLNFSYDTAGRYYYTRISAKF